MLLVVALEKQMIIVWINMSLYYSIAKVQIYQTMIGADPINLIVIRILNDIPGYVT